MTSQETQGQLQSKWKRLKGSKELIHFVDEEGRSSASQTISWETVTLRVQNASR